MRSEGNAPKNEVPTVGFSFTTISSTPVGFGQLFLSREQCDKLEYLPHSPDLSPADFYLFPRLITTFKVRRLCDASDIIKNATDELKAFTKWLPGMFQTPSQSFPECIVAQGGYFKGNVVEIIALFCISQK
jgi:hypothetical protein